jgi:hypothetical protein
VTLRRFDTLVAFGERGSLADAAAHMVEIGPAARLLVHRDEGAVRQAMAAIEAVLPPYESPKGGARFAAAAWIVTAKA